MRNVKMSFIFISEVIRVNPNLKLNEILNQVLLKDNKRGNWYLKLGSSAITSLLVYYNYVPMLISFKIVFALEYFHLNQL